MASPPSDIQKAAPTAVELHQSSALAGLDARISDPATPADELPKLIALRGEIANQDEFRANQGLLRRLANRASWGKIVFSAAAVALGTALFFAGHTLEGSLMLGIGFHWVAPELTKRIYDWLLGKERGDESE